MNIPLPAAQNLFRRTVYIRIRPKIPQICKIPPLICAAGPCLAARLRKPSASFAQYQSHALSCSAASEPFGFLGGSGSPAVCLRRRRSPFGSPCRLGKPALPVANVRAALVFPRGSGSPHAPPAASRWSPFARFGAASVVSSRASAPLGALRLRSLREVAGPALAVPALCRRAAA